MNNPIVRFFSDLMYNGLERFGKYYASYRAFVYRRDDPEGLGRIQLYVPSVYGTEPFKYWAWQVGNPSGFGYGWQWIPQVGEMVFVEFENGDPAKPMWKHGHPGKDLEGDSEKPPHLRDPDLYYLRTPKGLGIIFDEKTMEIKFMGGTVKTETTETLIQVGNNTVHVTDTGVNITTGEGSKVYLGGDKAVLYSKAPFSDSILDLKEIGVSNKVRVG